MDKGAGGRGRGGSLVHLRISELRDHWVPWALTQKLSTSKNTSKVFKDIFFILNSHLERFVY